MRGVTDFLDQRLPVEEQSDLIEGWNVVRSDEMMNEKIADTTSARDAASVTLDASLAAIGSP